MAKTQIEVNGKTFHQSYSGDMPPLAEHEFQNLGKSIKEHGIQNPVIVAPHKTEDGTVVNDHFDMIEGWNRARWAKNLGCELPLKVLPDDTPEDAKTNMAVEMNIARRQLDNKTITVYVKRLREQGLSYRDIQKKTGGTVTKTRAQRIVEGNGQRTIDLPKEDVTKPPRGQKHTDAEGVPLPDQLLPIFRNRTWFDSAATQVQCLQQLLKKLSEEPQGSRLDGGKMVKALEPILSAIKAACPHAVCPYCEASGAPCQACKKQGWVHKMLWDAAPKKTKEEHRQLAAAYAESLEDKNGK